mgnify:CR=1 FL=1
MEESDRLEKQTKTSVESFQCERLRGIAQVTIRRTVCVHENPKDNHLHGAKFVDCENKFDCGLFVWINKPYSFDETEDTSQGCVASRMVKVNGDL